MDRMSGRSISTGKVLLKRLSLVFSLHGTQHVWPLALLTLRFKFKFKFKYYAGSWKSGLIVLQCIYYNLWWYLTRSVLLEWHVERP